ncbi:MAG: RNA 2',3'-cyclic phosphodiesterase [Nitrospiraceae bacterium]|nr:RNA 2',3'-cyclic phosphodiesterase [Nitrospiraceae bacterium]
MALRCFIAVALPAAVKQSVGKMIRGLSETGADVKWVPEQNLHLTLKFLGATGEEKIEEMSGALRKKLSPYRPFYITIGGVGSFPGGRHPRVIWVGMQDYAPLEDIYREVEGVMTQLGYPQEDRPFSPHLTIGRVRSGKRLMEVLKRLDELRAVSFDEFEVKGVTLMKSELKPGGAEYSSLAEIPLEGNNGDQGDE